MSRKRFFTSLVLVGWAGFGAFLGGGCGSSHPATRTPTQIKHAARAPAPPTAPSFKIHFKDGYAYAHEKGRSWRIAEVTRNEMLWAPDGMRFAYLLPLKAKPAKGKDKGERFEIVIRNIRGDSVNAFPIYRPGKPSELEWMDDRVLCYRAPPDRTSDAYILHDAESGDILNVYRGKHFTWSPGKKRIAYVSGARKRQVIRVDNQQVWPRKQDRVRRRIVSPLVWSPDGSGLAFLERSGRKARLVVLLVVDNEDGDLSWAIPRRASTGNNKLFWAESKVLIGESTFKPRFAASWTRLR